MNEREKSIYFLKFSTRPWIVLCFMLSHLLATSCIHKSRIGMLCDLMCRSFSCVLIKIINCFRRKQSQKSKNVLESIKRVTTVTTTATMKALVKKLCELRKLFFQLSENKYRFQLMFMLSDWHKCRNFFNILKSSF
jgi:preprotein translocase subunit YajC